MTKKSNILLIEDNEGDVRLILEMLKEIGISTDLLIVNSGLKDALEMEIPPDGISLVYARSYFA
jgi:CheY-like chemotaxis protein